MPESLRGQFLIACKRLRDPNFFKSVVLIIEHGSSGAMGLVINRPSTVTVAHALSEHFKLPETDDVVYVGGPVEPSALFILHNCAERDESEAPIVEELYVGSNATVFEEVVRSAATDNPYLQFRIFSGCAGWAPDQLELELRRGDWYLHPATSDDVFESDPYELWDGMLKKVSQASGLLPKAPANPHWN